MKEVSLKQSQGPRTRSSRC